MKYKCNIKLILILIFLLFSLFFAEFRIKYISLNGINYKYENRVYNLLSSNYMNSNIAFLNNQQMLRVIQRVYPVANSLQIKRIYPDRVNVYIKNDNIKFTYKYKGRYFFVTNNGSILNGFYNKKYPFVVSNIKLSPFYKNKLISLINDIQKQISFTVSSYKLSTDNISLYLKTGQRVLLTFNKSIGEQISSTIYIVNNLPLSKCKTINVEFNKVYCSI